MATKKTETKTPVDPKTKAEAPGAADKQTTTTTISPTVDPATAGTERTDTMKIEVLPFRQQVIDMTSEFDTDVRISSSQMSSRYPKIQAIAEEFLNRLAGEEGKFTVGFFNFKDIAIRHQWGYYVLNRGAFDIKQWPPGTEQRLGVYIDATDAIRVDNKYVCFILTEKREKLLQGWRRELEQMEQQARRQAGHDKPVNETEAGEISAQFDSQPETIHL